MKVNRFKLLIVLPIIVFFGCKQGKLSDRESDLSVMSFNIRYATVSDGENQWDNRKQACLDMLNEEKPGIFGIQEGLYTQVAFFDDSLPAYSYVGVGRDDGQSAGEHCAIFYLSEHFELIEHGDFWLSETPEVPSLGWDADYNRMVTWAKFKVVYADKSLYVFNTHFDHIGEIAREESAKLLVNRAGEIAGKDAIVFITGDFNALIDNPIYDPILDQYHSARSSAERSDKRKSFNAWGQKDYYKNIDFIFYRNSKALSFKTVTDDFGVPYISDHYPIISHFEY